MLAILVATIVAAVAGIAAWLVDQRLLRCGTACRAVVATVLVVISIWIAALIQAAFWLKVPGAYGPVQFWHSDPNALDFMSGPRTLSLFLILGGMGLAALAAVAGLVSLFFPSERPRWWRLVVPAFAIGAYALAHYWFLAYEFFPSA